MKLNSVTHPPGPHPHNSQEQVKVHVPLSRERSTSNSMRSFFTEFTFAKAVLYGSCSIYVFGAAAAVMIEPHLNLSCDQKTIPNSPTSSTTTTHVDSIQGTGNSLD
eukprot:scaffold93091_cov70-Cyclotella_meneghiniana.AAC.1